MRKFSFGDFLLSKKIRSAFRKCWFFYRYAKFIFFAEDYQHHQFKKNGQLAMTYHTIGESHFKPNTWCEPAIYNNWLDLETQQLSHANNDIKQSSFRIGDECINDR